MGIKLDQRDSREAVADCEMQILWAQRASQHRAHFLYNPSQPFQFTWGVSSSRTMAFHLIWFLPGITCLCGDLFTISPDTGTFVNARWKIRWAGWRNNDSHSSKAKLCLHIILYNPWEIHSACRGISMHSCFRPLTFTVLLFVTDSSQWFLSQNSKIPHPTRNILHPAKKVM